MLPSHKSRQCLLIDISIECRWANALGHDRSRELLDDFFGNRGRSVAESCLSLSRFFHHNESSIPLINRLVKYFLKIVKKLCEIYR